MASYEERRQSFAQYLKERQVEAGYIPREVIAELPDEAILEAYRKNSEDGQDLYSDTQEYGVIMEYSTNESIYQALENMKNQNHLDAVEKQLLKEFSKDMKPIQVSNINTKAVLAKLHKIGVTLNQDDVAHLLSEACSFFPQWIMQGHKFYIEEHEPGNISVGADKLCIACFLNETLHRFKTVRAWAHHTDSGQGGDHGLKTCNEIFIAEFSDYFFNYTLDRNEDFDPDSEKTFVDILLDLLGLVYDYVVDSSLISCWIAGKEVAQDKMNINEQESVFLNETHEHFCKKYPSGVVAKDKGNYIKDLKEYIGQLSMEQLEVLSESGIPIDMTKSIENKTFKIIDELIEKMQIHEIEDNPTGEFL